MQEIRSSDPPVVIAICDSNKSQARQHCSLKLVSTLKYLNLDFYFERLKHVQIVSLKHSKTQELNYI